MRGSARVWFATSNDHKYEEASYVLTSLGIGIGRLPSKGDELQSEDPSEIAMHAAKAAYTEYRRPLFVEDTGLFIGTLGGFPGTSASYVFKTVGQRGVLRLMEEAADRHAEFISAVAYSDGHSRPRVFTGRLSGTIARRSLGQKGFGFDPIFIPQGGGVTLAQLDMRQKCQISHRAVALKSLASWLNWEKSRQRLSAQSRRPG